MGSTLCNNWFSRKSKGFSLATTGGWSEPHLNPRVWFQSVLFFLLPFFVLVCISSHFLFNKCVCFPSWLPLHWTTLAGPLPARSPSQTALRRWTGCPPEISRFFPLTSNFERCFSLGVFWWKCGRGSRPWPTQSAFGLLGAHFVKPWRSRGRAVLGRAVKKMEKEKKWAKTQKMQFQEGQGRISEKGQRA